MDADLSHDPSEVQKLLEASKSVDLLQGSRYISGGKIIGWGISRKMISKGANYICHLLLKTGMHEHTTYFRVYSRELAESLINNLDCNGFEFAIESLLFAKYHGFTIKEIPITFVDRRTGESKLGISGIYKWWAYVLKVLIKRAFKNY